MALIAMKAVGNSGGAGGWTFIADSNNQLALADALTNAANNFDSRKSEMYGKIDSMGNYWKGEDYNLFNTSAHNYDTALSDFSDSLRMYASQFETISGATEDLSTTLYNIIMNMTSFTSGGSNSTPGGTTNGNGTTQGGTSSGGGVTTKYAPPSVEDGTSGGGVITGPTTKYAPPSIEEGTSSGGGVTTKYAPPTITEPIIGGGDAVVMKYAPPTVTEPIIGGTIGGITTKYAPPTIEIIEGEGGTVAMKYAPPIVETYTTEVK